MDARRRTMLMVIGGGIATYAGLRTLPPLMETIRPSALTLEPMDRPAGFRRLVAGGTSARMDAFAGLRMDSPSEIAARSAADMRVAEAPCAALFDRSDMAPGVVPVASFSDYYCPFCKTQTPELAAREAANPDRIALSWHETPLFGDSSLQAAKAALAAREQGAYVAFHARLMRSAFHATPAYLRQLAADIGIDGERLLADMDSPRIARRLEDSAALARLLGLAGTPALVIGRTVVLGEVEAATLDQIIALERDGGWRAACGAPDT